MDLLETNVDDVSGEVIADAITRFMDAGARDASATPIVMKKGRPGFLIKVISLPDTSARLAELMAQELGYAGHPLHSGSSPVYRGTDYRRSRSRNFRETPETPGKIRFDARFGVYTEG